MTASGREMSSFCSPRISATASVLDMGYGSAIAAGMFILITLVALIIMKLMNGKGDD